MRRTAPALFASVAVLAFATAACSQQQPQQKGEPTRPREEATAPAGAPVEAGAANVPEFQPAFAGQTRAPAVKTRTALDVATVASGLDRPWALAFLPDGRMLVTLKGGAMHVVTAQGQISAPLAGVPAVDDRDQGGLLDVALAPDFARSRMLVFTYAERRAGGSGLAVATARLNAGATGLEGVKVIWRAQPTLDSTKHNGGRVAFGPDGKLYIASGERSIVPGRVQAEQLDSALGKIVRLNLDGSIPADNPYVGRAGAKPEIWTSGHRNPLSLAFDGQGRLWEVEMGPRGGDEVNLIAKGKNYGWPTIGYGEEYSGAPIHQRTQQAGLEQPVYYWDPVISPSGLAIYSGSLLPEWRGNVFIGGLSSKALVRLVMDGERVAGEERLLTERGKRVRDVRQGPDGALYVLEDGPGAALLRLSPKT